MHTLVLSTDAQVGFLAGVLFTIVIALLVLTVRARR